MTHLRKMMLEELQRRNLSKLTAEYPRAVEGLARFYKRPPDQLGPEQIRQYQAYLFTKRKLDANTVAQHLSAIRFFFIKTLKRNWSVEETPYPKRPIRLPDVLSREEVQRLIDSADSPLHRVWLLMLYATYGFLSSRRRRELVPLCKELLADEVSSPTPMGAPTTSESVTMWTCPLCGGPMIVIERLTAGQIPLRSPPQANLT